TVLLILILTSGAPPERRRRRIRPRRGAAQGCAAFSARAGCPLGKSRRLRGPGAQHRARRRGVLSLRQVSLHKQRKVARAVTARKLLILMSAKERRVKTRPTGLRGPSGAAGAADKTRRGAAHGCAAFSAEAGCLLGKSRRLRGPGAKHRARRRGVFLCARFLCTSKERWLAPSRRESS